MQELLDPTKAHSTLLTWTPDHPIPRSVRNWGFCADFSNWLPGDLILVSAQKPGFIQQSIRRIQAQGGYDTVHARWEHAAVYIGSSALCEATRKGVVVSDIYQYIGQHLIRVRRNPTLNNDQRWELAVNALKLRSYRYGYRSILNLLWKSQFSGYWGTRTFTYPQRTRICSELYADAHTKASNGIILGNITSGEITPASLSMEKKLIDVKTKWVKII
jgi:hypothetical protein